MVRLNYETSDTREKLEIILVPNKNNNKKIQVSTCFYHFFKIDLIYNKILKF